MGASPWIFQRRPWGLDSMDLFWGTEICRNWGRIPEFCRILRSFFWKPGSISKGMAPSASWQILKGHVGFWQIPPRKLIPPNSDLIFEVHLVKVRVLWGRNRDARSTKWATIPLDPNRQVWWLWVLNSPAPVFLLVHLLKKKSQRTSTGITRATPMRTMGVMLLPAGKPLQLLMRHAEGLCTDWRGWILSTSYPCSFGWCDEVQEAPVLSVARWIDISRDQTLQTEDRRSSLGWWSLRSWRSAGGRLLRKKACWSTGVRHVNQSLGIYIA